jgi:hypothetical protein
MMDAIAEARAERLGIIREILASCRGAGQSVDVDLIAEVLQEGLDLLGPEPEKPRPLTEEEQSVFCAISCMQNALTHLAWHMARGMQPSRSRGQLDHLPLRMAKLVAAAIEPRQALMTRNQVAEMWAEANRWAYVIWSPAEQIAMFQILAAASRGEQLTSDLRARAGDFLERYARAMPLGDMWLRGGNGRGRDDG